MFPKQKKINEEREKKASGLIVISDGFQFHRENVRTTKKEIEQQKKNEVIYKCIIVHWVPLRIDKDGWLMVQEYQSSIRKRSHFYLNKLKRRESLRPH